MREAFLLHHQGDAERYDHNQEHERAETDAREFHGITLTAALDGLAIRG